MQSSDWLRGQEGMWVDDAALHHDCKLWAYIQYKSDWDGTIWLRRTVEKMGVKDDRVRALENERHEVQQKIDVQQQEYAQQMELLKADYETLMAAVRC